MNKSKKLNKKEMKEITAGVTHRSVRADNAMLFKGSLPPTEDGLSAFIEAQKNGELLIA